MVDYYFENVPLPRYFQWNILNHTTRKTCFDIDGVLCADPLPEQNDDGEKYIDFILNAPPLFIPGSKIGTIVTSRLEYRIQTETWLEIIISNIMIWLCLIYPIWKPDNANNHGDHKAKAYMAKPYVLFIESELNQAIEINRISKNQFMYG
jgi:hypothetical protein